MLSVYSMPCIWPVRPMQAGWPYREIMAAAVGTVQQVLCETRTEGGAVIGYTRGYLPCRLEGGANPGDTVTVTIERADGDWLYAQYE